MTPINPVQSYAYGKTGIFPGGVPKSAKPGSYWLADSPTGWSSCAEALTR